MLAWMHQLSNNNKNSREIHWTITSISSPRNYIFSNNYCSKHRILTIIKSCLSKDNNNNSHPPPLPLLHPSITLIQSTHLPFQLQLLRSQLQLSTQLPSLNQSTQVAWTLTSRWIATAMTHWKTTLHLARRQLLQQPWSPTILLKCCNPITTAIHKHITSNLAD